MCALARLEGGDGDVGELSGVGDEFDFGDAVAFQGEGEGDDDAAVRHPCAAGDAVDEDEFDAKSLPGEAASDRVGPAEDGGDPAVALAHLEGGVVGSEFDIGVEDGDESLEVAGARGAKEGLDNVPVAGEVDGGVVGGAMDPAAATAGELAGSDGSASDDLRDLVEGDAEDVVEDEGDALGRGEVLKDREHGKANGLGEHRFAFRVDGIGEGIAVDGEGFFAASLASAEHIEADAGDDGGQPAGEIVDAAGVHPGEAEPRFLDGVIGLAGGPEQPERDLVKVGAMRFEAAGKNFTVHLSHSPAGVRQRVERPLLPLHLKGEPT